MKKLIVLVLTMACVLSLVGCSKNLSSNIDEATELKIVQYDVSNGEKTVTVTITDGTSINHIVDNLKSLKLKKIENNDPTVLEYKLTFYKSNGEAVETISISVNDWLGFDGYFHSITSGELDRAYILRFFNPIEYKGKYANDSNLIIINSDSVIASDNILNHYKNGGIILATYWTYAEQIQTILSPAVTTSFSASDAAVLFYKTASGAPSVSTAGGNTSDWDSEIDEMIDNAKSNQ